VYQLGDKSKIFALRRKFRNGAGDFEGEKS